MNTKPVVIQFSAEEARAESFCNRNVLSDQDVEIANLVTAKLQDVAQVGSRELNFQVRDLNFIDCMSVSFNSKLVNHFQRLGFTVERSEDRNEEYLKISW